MIKQSSSKPSLWKPQSLIALEWSRRLFNQVLEKESPGKIRADISGSQKRRLGEMKRRRMNRNELRSVQHTLSQGWAGTQDSGHFSAFQEISVKPTRKTYV